jgi:hypothetical protein
MGVANPFNLILNTSSKFVENVELDDWFERHDFIEYLVG